VRGDRCVCTDQLLHTPSAAQNNGLSYILHANEKKKSTNASAVPCQPMRPTTAEDHFQGGSKEKDRQGCVIFSPSVGNIVVPWPTRLLTSTQEG